jgi:4'-phosphopantetheinyl transferase
MRAPEILWKLPPSDPRLIPGEILVLAASLELPPARLRELTGLLSEDERARASRFHFAHHRNRFIAARGTLREILERLLEVEAGRFTFSYDDAGKPRLAGPAAARRVQFNLAHSDSLAVYALGAESDLGVDVERLRPVPEAEQIASRFFSLREAACLRSLPRPQQTEAFFRCWTRKEAYLKAVGQGLSGPLSRIEVSLLPEEPARFVRIGQDPQAPAIWRLHSLIPAHGYIGALAVKNRAAQASCWKWVSDRHRVLSRRMSDAASPAKGPWPNPESTKAPGCWSGPYSM